MTVKVKHLERTTRATIKYYVQVNILWAEHRFVIQKGEKKTLEIIICPDTNLMIYAILLVICWNNLLKLRRMNYAKLNPKLCEIHQSLPPNNSLNTL